MSKNAERIRITEIIQELKDTLAYAKDVSLVEELEELINPYIEKERLPKAAPMIHYRPGLTDIQPDFTTWKGVKGNED